MYTSVTNVENYLLLDIDSSFTTQIESWITAMTNQVSLMTNREWLADSTATARYFDGNGNAYLRIGEAIEVTEVALGEDYGESFTATTEYITYPYNGDVITKLILKDDCFDRGIKNVKITAKWGYAEEVPEDIQFATTVLVAGIVLAQSNQDGEVESEKIGEYAVTYKTDEQKNDFKRAMDILAMRRVILL